MMQEEEKSVFIPLMGLEFLQKKNQINTAGQQHHDASTPAGACLWLILKKMIVPVAAALYLKYSLDQNIDHNWSMLCMRIYLYSRFSR